MSSTLTESPAAANHAGASETSSESRELVLKVLGAVGTGIGILGFVTLFGGAILWVRANEVGLPANEAVAVVPRSVLVTTGASFLVPAVLLALLAVLLIAAIHLAFAVPNRLKTRIASREARELRNRADAALRLAEPQEQVATATREKANELSALLTQIGSTPGAGGQVEPMRQLAEGEHQQAQQLEKGASEARTAAEKLDAHAKEAEAKLQSARISSPVADDVRLGVECVAAFVILAFLPLFAYGNLFDVGLQRALILIGVACAAAIVTLAVYLASEKFVWLGVVAFVSVGIYTGCATYFRTIRNPKVEPVAVLRGDRAPVVGLFVAATSESVYLGGFRDGRLRARLLIVPRSQITDLVVGPLLAPSVARTSAVELAEHECRQQVEQPGDGTDIKDTASCTRRQELGLQAQM